ncbi:hypothetical protein B0A48_02549 [Cryoendolithus antarcticus]|uniref:Uncharacterized protein n=1 Tax=Cryoendolithus antarcticus TaxID=1507870 RepID=A0A1V8TNZ5_9PEZI|nr:hypothetical protein B0A48_02549 [Cryoendolithus antarcticus]
MFGTTYNDNGWLPEANCFGGHGISNTFMDHAAALFCDATDGLILNLNSMRNNSVAMTYTYWPPSSVGVVGNCAEAGQVYLQIGFGLGAPNTTAYTLSRQSCARGLGQVYNMACDNSHVDNKRGGQMDLGTHNATLHDPAFNDHLFYLVDPAPPIAGRNIYCTNYNRFVPKFENTNVLKDADDPCYEAHLGFGGNDAWDAVPIVEVTGLRTTTVGRSKADDDRAMGPRPGYGRKGVQEMNIYRSRDAGKGPNGHEISKTGKIHWGNVADPLALYDGMHNNGRLPDPVCFGGHAPNNDKWDGCTEAGQIYMHIGFGLGAPNKTVYILSTQSCARGLRQVYNMGCDNSHVDNKHGGQMDLGRFERHRKNDRFNDHLVYLIDPAPPAEGRSVYCTNYMRFVPNLENTNVLDEFIDPCYEVHMGYGGMDKLTVDPPSWKDHGGGKYCSTPGGIYDINGGTWGNY